MYQLAASQGYRSWRYGAQPTWGSFEKNRRLGSKASPAESDSLGGNSGTWIFNNLPRGVPRAQREMTLYQVLSVLWEVLWPQRFNLHLPELSEVTLSRQKT